MGKERLMAFTDAVLAIIMTILVLELEKPEAATFEARRAAAGIPNITFFLPCVEAVRL